MLHIFCDVSSVIANERRDVFVICGNHFEQLLLFKVIRESLEMLNFRVDNHRIKNVASARNDFRNVVGIHKLQNLLWNKFCDEIVVRLISLRILLDSIVVQISAERGSDALRYSEQKNSGFERNTGINQRNVFWRNDEIVKKCKQNSRDYERFKIIQYRVH